MAYNPFERVAEFETKYGYDGVALLNAINKVDPYRCYYGADCNPDEYLGYAIRYLEDTHPSPVVKLASAFREELTDEEIRDILAPIQQYY